MKGNMIEKARHATLMKEAYLCNSSLELVMAIVKMKFKGTLTQKENGLRQEILKYFNNKLDMDISSDNFMPKMEADNTNQS